MNNMNREYQESNLEWLGHIPEKWKLKKSKWNFSDKSIKGFPNEKLLSVSKGKGLVSRAELEFKAVMALKDLESFKLVQKNDFVIHLRSFQSGFEMSDIRGIVSPAYTVFSGDKEIEPKYYKYLFYMQTFIDYIASTTQSLRDGKPISYKEFSNMLLPHPPIEEQKNIARFLENKLSKIEKIIKKKEELILLLKEERNAKILEIVTKGLKNNIELKETNIEWIGKIPSDWKLEKAKWLFNEKTIKGFSNEKLLSVSKGKGLIPRDEMEINVVMALKDLENFKLVQKNDFVIHLRSFQSGFEMSDIRGIVSPAYTVFEGNEKVYPNYFKYVFYTQKFIEYISSTTQSLRDGKPVAYKDFKDMYLPLPNINEQIRIARYLEEVNTTVHKISKQVHKQIKMLKEYRQGLIYEAVTGKIDVRELELD